MSSKTSPTSAIHPPVGTFIDGGSLELVEVLGVGGYGVVYRAIDARHPPGPKSYAVKCLVASGNQTPRQRQIHIREIALHQLASAHPGVVTLHRVVEQGSHTYIIMDYAPDHDLFTQILHSCRYLGDDGLIKDVFLQLLDAVEYCHSLGIYHRDLKPENILCFDDGLRIAITDFGLATTDKLSDEFRTGSVYHMSPECQGGEFAPTSNYSPMFNDIWSLGIILLNLATGRNPWKSATPGDPTFQAYLRDPMGFLPTVLPISPEINEVLVRMLEVDWRERMTLREVRYAIEEINNFYSDGVVFEGSMARCPWESGMEIDSASSGTSPEDVGPQSPPAEPAYTEDVDAQLASHWSKDSTSDIIFAQSFDQESSYGAPWVYSSCPPAWAYDSVANSSDSDEDHMDFFDRMRTPDLTESPGSSLPATPNSLDTTFDCKITRPEPRSGLMINTNIPRPHIYDATTSITSFSPNTSIMLTAIEEPYSNMLFSNSPVSPGKRAFMPDSAITAVDDEEMTSPSLWSSTSATEMSSPSSYSDSSVASSLHGEDQFRRSSTPSPEPLALWAQYQLQVQSPPQQCQLSSSVSTSMTNVLPHSRLSNSLFASKRHPDLASASSPSDTPTRVVSPATPSSSGAGSKSSTLSRFAIKFFPRSPSPSPASASPATAFPHGRTAAEPPRASPARRQEASPTAEPPAWGSAQVVAPGKAEHFLQESDTASSRHAAAVVDKNAHRHLQEQQQHRLPRHWFMTGRFRVSGGVK